MTHNKPNIVLVHGAWRMFQLEHRRREPAGARTQRHGAPISLTALADDLDRLRHVLNLQDGPTSSPATPTVARYHRPGHGRAECRRSRLHRGVRNRRGGIARWAAVAGPSDPGTRAPIRRRRGLRLG